MIDRVGTGKICDGKRSFPSYHDAAKAAKQHRRFTESRVTEYRCKYCGKWHVGNETADARKRKDEKTW